ncbi:unnamed protein product [Phaedon cochleariae]|uniref:Uncharacterized protein n=1 Tax=Phaedon cochleariae TaxID=80249 RepID=A0A9P0DGU6_PHACE|nr:unnamed protein product [Phaedon cochleariae]
MGKRKLIQIGDTMTTKDRIILCAGEVAGTAVLVFIGCLGCVKGVTPGGVIPHEQISFSFGLAVMMSVQIFGHISGAHINPMVTTAAATLGHIPLIQVPIFFVGQILGSVLGYGLVQAATPSHYLGNVYRNVSGELVKTGLGVCSPSLSPLITPGQGLLVEFVLSAILALVCCGVWDSRNADKHDSVAIKFGLSVAVLAMSGGPYTGANMNPARSFGPALLNGDWDNHWIYWVGPIAAGLFAGLIYRLVFTKDEEPSSKETLPECVALNSKP